MVNVFENVKFGDIYISNDGAKNTFCSFTISNDQLVARLYRERWGIIIFYLDGKAHSGTDFGNGIDFSIKEQYIKPIDEDKLDKIANECYYEMSDVANVNCADVKEAFKRGYRKAKEE